MGRLPEYVRTLGNLEMLIAHVPEDMTHDIKAMVHDGLRFLLSFKIGIELAPLQVYASALVFSPENSIIRKIFSQQHLNWISLKPIEKNWNACLQTLETHSDDSFSSMVFLPMKTNLQLVSGSLKGVISIWDVTNGACLKTWEGDDNDEDAICSLAVPANGKQLVSGSMSGIIKVWSLDTSKLLRVLIGHILVVQSLVVSENGSRLVSESLDETIRVWQIQTGQCLCIIDATQPIESIALWPSGAQILVETINGVQILDAATGRCIHSLDKKIRGVALSPDGTQLAVSSLDDRVLEIRGTITYQVTEHVYDGIAFDVAFSSENERVTYLRSDRAIMVWNCEGETVLALAGNRDSKLFSPGDSRIVCKSNGTIQIWDASTAGVAQNSLQDSDNHVDVVISIAVSLDGSLVISMSLDGTIKVWNATTGAHMLTSEDQSRTSTVCALSVDGRLAAFVGYSKSYRNNSAINIWYTHTPVCKCDFEGHQTDVSLLGFSPSGSHLASASKDGVVRFWDINTAECLRTLRDDSSISVLAFSSDGTLLAFGDISRRIYIWNSMDNTMRCSVTNYLACSPMNKVQLHTNVGDFDLQSKMMHPKDMECFRELYISQDKVWIMKKQTRLLWIPPEYRPLSAGFGGMTIAMGYQSGRVLIFQFRLDAINL